MHLLFELSKEHTQLPVEEIRACFNSMNLSYHEITHTQDIYIIATDATISDVSLVAQRISHSFSVCTFLFSSTLDISRLKQLAVEHKIPMSGSIAIRHKNRSQSIDSSLIIQSLATVYTKNRTVSLTDPDIEIRVIITDDQVYVGILLFLIDRTQFNKRKAQFRPFFSPISLHPKLARLLVNLSEISTDGILLDPFCGTGGFLIEAGLLGIRIIGADIDKKMIDGCQKNLIAMGISDKQTSLFQTDIGDISTLISQKVDAVVTDFPYGKATTTKGEERNHLYKRAFHQISSVLAPGGKAVIGLPFSTTQAYQMDSFKQRHCYPLRVHRSLTRYFYIYEKQP